MNRIYHGKMGNTYCNGLSPIQSVNDVESAVNRGKTSNSTFVNVHLGREERYDSTGHLLCVRERL